MKTSQWSRGPALLAVLVLSIGAACAAGSPPRAHPASGAVEATPAQLAQAAYDRMTPAQRIGQLFMIGMPSTGTTTAQRSALTQLHIGNVMLFRHSYSGVTATATVVAQLRRATTQSGARPLVATDQEGGLVQDLNGEGFSDIPTALQQGQWVLSTLRTRAARWGGQLVRAGVNLDLAPVADVVPASVGTSNQPIGRYYREYGYTPTRVANHVVAFVEGMRDAGELTTVKHFPGLGRATGNPDATSYVTDPTTRTDPYLQPFKAAIAANVRFVMVSTAVYPNIDANRRAAFSPSVVNGLLRRTIGFAGVVVSDSLTSASASVVPASARGWRFIRAGGDLILVTGMSPVPAMIRGIRDHMQASAQFAQAVHTAVLRVLTAKARAGLLG